jgi:hypothetical protein
MSIVAADDPVWAPTFVLAALFVAAEHRDRVFSDETGLSGSIAVALAAAIFFADRGWVGGALICCAAGGAYLPHLRTASIAKIVVNAACFGLSAFFTALIVAPILNDADGPALTIVTLIAATAAYWFANSLLLAIATAAISHRSLSREFAGLVRSDTVMLAFGFGGAVCGVVMTEVGVWTGVATLVALLVALDVFVISVPAGLTVLRSAWAVVVARGVSGGVAGSVSALVTRSVALSAVGAVAGLAAGVVAGVLVVMLIVALRLLAHRRRVDAALLGGIALVELAFPLIGAITGVVTALAGFSAGLVCASALVIGGSACVAVRRRRSRNAPPEIDDDTAMVAVFEALLEGRPTPARER